MALPELAKHLMEVFPRGEWDNTEGRNNGRIIVSSRYELLDNMEEAIRRARTQISTITGKFGHYPAQSGDVMGDVRQDALDMAHCVLAYYGELECNQ